MSNDDETVRRAFSRLAKIDTTGMKHTQKLDAFAKALTFASQTALMGFLKEREGGGSKQIVAEMGPTSSDIIDAIFLQVRGTDLDPLPEETFLQEIRDGDTNFRRYEPWWQHHIEHIGPDYLDQILGADLSAALDAFIIEEDRGQATPESARALLGLIRSGLDLRIEAGVGLGMSEEEARDLIRQAAEGSSAVSDGMKE